MKNTLTLGLICLLPFNIFAQKKITKPTEVVLTYEEVIKSNDSKTIAGFIKNNPNHPNTNILKGKLFALITPIPDSKTYDSSPTKEATRASGKNSKTAELLNHLLNEDKNSKEAVLVIENKSNCNFTIKFIGKNNYTLDVMARGKNYLQISKGTYTLSTNICNTKYVTTKDISTNLSMAFSDK